MIDVPRLPTDVPPALPRFFLAFAAVFVGNVATMLLVLAWWGAFNHATVAPVVNAVGVGVVASVAPALLVTVVRPGAASY